jgi:hypothetical protein
MNQTCIGKKKHPLLPSVSSTHLVVCVCLFVFFSVEKYYLVIVFNIGNIQSYLVPYSKLSEQGKDDLWSVFEFQREYGTFDMEDKQQRAMYKRLGNELSQHQYQEFLVSPREVCHRIVDGRLCIRG